MEESIFKILTEGGPMALFAGYLIWQTREQQKRIDGWINQISDLEEKSQEREDKLRKRYDDVILKIESEKGDLSRSLIEKMAGVIAKLNEIEKEIKVFAVRITILEKEQEKKNG